MKCPHCSMTPPRFKGKVTETIFGKTAFHTIAYCCPLCDSVISVQIDPTILKEEIIERLSKPKKT